MKSIVHEKDGTCFLCILLDGYYGRHSVIHEHHVYGGPNRRISEKNGLKVYLCLNHHVLGKKAVHNNIEIMRILQKAVQRIFERIHTRQQFMALLGRNYLGDEPEETEKEESKRNSLSGITFLEE